MFLIRRPLRIEPLQQNKTSVIRKLPTVHSIEKRFFQCYYIIKCKSQSGPCIQMQVLPEKFSFKRKKVIVTIRLNVSDKIFLASLQLLNRDLQISHVAKNRSLCGVKVWNSLK